MKKFSFFLMACAYILCALFVSTTAKADRAGASELSWTWVRDSTYKLTFRLYKDCAGPTAEPTTVNVCYYNNCNAFTGAIALGKAAITGNGDVVQNACSSPANTTCGSPAGTIPGYREWVYEGFVTLPARCKYWHFVASIAERNSAAITNLTFGAGPSDRNIFVEATLDNLNAPGSSAPVFPKPGVAYICDGAVQVLEYGGVDPDGDVLTYSLINPQTAPNNQVSCVFPPASTGIALAPGINLANNPFLTGSSFNLNNANGTMTFTPIGVQSPVLSVLVQKWRGANVIGTITRGLQFRIINCNTPLPSVGRGAVTGGLDKGDSILACPGSALSFCINVTSPDPTVKITLDDNHLTFCAPPLVNGGSSAVASTMTYSNQATDNVQGCFNWIPTLADSNSHILLLKATYCKPGNPALTQVFAFKINIGAKTWALRDTMICLGEEAELKAYGGTSFNWVIADGTGSTVGITAPIPGTKAIVKPSQTTIYEVTSDYPTFCRLNVDSVKVTVLNPKIDPGPDTTICNYNSLQLDAHLLNPEAGIDYTWLWTPGTYLTDSTIPNPIVKYPKDYIRYKLTVIPGGVARCAVSDEIWVKVLKGFNLTNKDTAICQGASVKINGWGDTGYTYTWVPSTAVSNPAIYNPVITPTAPTTYTLLAAYKGCTDSIRKISIDVQPIPVVDAGPDRTICFGDTMHMKGTVTSDANTYKKYIYSWAPGGALNRADTLEAIFTGYLSEQITFTVSTPAGCSGSDKVNYIVRPRPFLEVSPDISICPGTIGNIWAKGDDQLQSLTWTPGKRIDSVHSKTPKVWPDFTADYVVVARDVNNCIDSAKVRVNVLPRAVIYLEDSTTIYPGNVYQLQPQGNCLDYKWFPPVGLSNPSIANPVANPVINTRYYVTGTTAEGCVTTDSIDIFIAPDSYIDMPNAFVPGDGPNSIFKPFHLGNITLRSMMIFNRWGMKIFETRTTGEGWDGTYQNEPQPLGVYVYVIEAVTANGKVVKKQGNLTLIR